MEMMAGIEGREGAVIELFSATFSASEGAAEGALVGGLVRDLLGGSAPGDIRLFCAVDAGRLIGAGLFTRLDYAQDPRRVMLLSPMAVATDRQGQGVGQALLTHALEALQAEGVDVAVTYGDPAFYGRVGFVPITEAQARAPLPLSRPEGWLGRPLVARRMPELRGPSTCVPALNDAAYW